MHQPNKTPFYFAVAFWIVSFCLTIVAYGSGYWFVAEGEGRLFQRLGESFCLKFEDLQRSKEGGPGSRVWSSRDRAKVRPLDPETRFVLVHCANQDSG